MVSDIDDERPITFNQAGTYLPASARPCQATWWRWWRKGLRGERLQTMVIGGRRYTTVRFLLEWISRVTAAANHEPPPIRTPARRARDIAMAKAELDDDRRHKERHTHVTTIQPDRKASEESPR